MSVYFIRSFLVVSFLVVSMVLCCLSARASNPQTQLIEKQAAAIYPELVEIRRDLFAHPEASGEEKRTAAVVAKYLNGLGLEVMTQVGGHGVVGILKGSKPGKQLVWRADMDAARFEFGDHDHTAKQVAHVCGHDVHTAMGLGIANTLTQFQQDLAGTVYFLFQPAEESQKGAKAMINDGLFEKINADEVYGAHVGPSELGKLSTRPGNLFAHSRYIEMEFTEVSNHEELTDAVHAMTNSLNRIRHPEKFLNLAAMSDTEIGITSPDTIYQNYILFGGKPYADTKTNKTVVHVELYTANLEDIDLVTKSLETMLNESAYSKQFVSLAILHEREGVDNNPALVTQNLEFLQTTFGNEVLDHYFGQIPFASEDFGHFQKIVPGVFFFIGASNAEKGIMAFPHMPNFDVDEKVMERGVIQFSQLLLNRLQTN